MNEIEKSAIETIRDLKYLKWYEHAFDNGTEVLDEEQKQDIEIILNLIEKQSKEIEELKEDSCCMTNCVRRDKEKLFLEHKIKAKIEYYEKIDNPVGKRVLQSLLEKE